MPLEISPETESLYRELLDAQKMDAFQLWNKVVLEVSEALLGPNGEECENLVGSLGPEFEDDEVAILALMQRLKPEIALKAALKMNPSFDLNMEPEETVQTIVETIMALRERPHPQTKLFCTLDSQRIADLIRSAERFVGYAAPGVQVEPAQALAAVSARLGAGMVTVCLDVDERVMRMGFGKMDAVKYLLDAGIVVHHAPGLRIALVVVDEEGYIFTPTALYLEAEPQGQGASNAMHLSGRQLREALARLSPVANEIAVAQAQSEEERGRIANLPVEVGSQTLTVEHCEHVEQSLKEAPPVQFDLARQVRVFNSYLQYVELNLTGAAIQRHRLAIPPIILKLGGSKDLEGRLRTTFDLIEKGGELSSKKLEDELNDIRKNFTPSLGKDHGAGSCSSRQSHIWRSDWRPFG